MQFAAYGGVGLLIIIVQVLISRFLSIAGVSPDFLLIFLMYVTMREGQFAGIVSGFVLGLGLDIMSSGIFGAHALSKTVACFLVGFFYDRERLEQNIRNWPFLMLTLLGAIINNALYYFLLTRGGEMSFAEFAFQYGAVGALYTVFIAIFPLLYWSRKRAY
ncbi:MAG: rod shape-determining protein MreD [Bacteroidota bacterium]|nr:rod shape-determining protein MreD [Bacteroidota bacterium]MDP4233505.1 rod shape-determining protein MreD [Bacteroidota bacterium]MDP4243382.1 rod shape-determining protein MreD [Bacteroidota bacterium]MDP4287931.1 rod shape-determining protein MreD [Bacteroidota bacterium]